MIAMDSPPQGFILAIAVALETLWFKQVHLTAVAITLAAV